MSDPYKYSETECLKNIPGIKNLEKLARFEAHHTSERIHQIEKANLKKTFDLEHLKRIHRHIFQDVYSWAGQLRTVNIAKGNHMFANPQFLENAGSIIFKRLKKENILRDLNTDMFADRAGYYLGEINALHPFREGNGRTQREFINTIARENGYFIEWGKISRDDMTRASIESTKHDAKMMSELIRSNLIDLDYEKAVDIVKHSSKSRFDIEKAQPETIYCGNILAQTKRHIVQVLEHNPKHIIIHQQEKLIGNIDINKAFTISYTHGQAGLVKSHQSEKELQSKKDALIKHPRDITDNNAYER